ncbi:DUF292-domain-containing protein [Hysterangium stoloniferum]|nr:DUF292-domain-containing protein [Hysterangium stoloniferum]
MVLWNAARTKVQLRLAVQRLRMLQEKKSAQAKSARRDIATLIERGKLETARIKVENIINEDIYVELLELIELYCELLIARFGLLEISAREPDPGIYEGVTCVIHAAPRTEIKELHILRELLMHKFGREFSIAVMENRDGCVNERVMRKLSIVTPGPTLVDAYLDTIAKGYGIDWEPTPRPPTSGNAPDSGGDEGVKALKEAIPTPLDTTANPDATAKDSPSVSASASASTEAINQMLDAKATAAKLPSIPPTEGDPPPYKPSTSKPIKSALKKSSLPPPDEEQASQLQTQTGPPENDFLTLMKRFEALKKR